MTDYKEYWNTQFSNYNYIWGQRHSQSAEIALPLFRQQQVKKILIPGSGYGRNSKLFSASGFEVTGIEISEEAYRLAQAYDPATKVYNESFLEDSFVREHYEGIYCFNVIHLFLQADRLRFIGKCAEALAPGGCMFFTAISDEDESFGQGEEIEAHTFMVKPNKILHFFTAADLRSHFSDFQVFEEGSLVDEVTHTLYGPKRYRIRYIFCGASSRLPQYNPVAA